MESAITELKAGKAKVNEELFPWVLSLEEMRQNRDDEMW